MIEVKELARPLFSVTIKDCKVDTFCAGGKGGQHQNKTETGVRVTHEPSGAVGESRETRSQLENKRRAFGRMAKTKEFQRWARIEASRLAGRPSVEEMVDRQLVPTNLSVEVQDDSGRWVKEK